jgi:hypothetical protein
VGIYFFMPPNRGNLTHSDIVFLFSKRVKG